MTHHLSDKTFMVTGASGQLGRAVLHQLLDSGATHVVAATRTPEKLEAFAARGVDVRRADFDDPESLSAAFTGVDRLLIISTDAVTIPGTRPRQHRAAIAAAAYEGVEHILYTSLTCAEPGSPVYLAVDHCATEQALAACGVPYTALRHNMYADSLPHRMSTMLKEGRAIAAAGSGGVAYVTREDCARVAAAVLLSPDPQRGPLEVGGDEAVTPKQLTRLVSEITGHEITFSALTEAELYEAFKASGMHEKRAAMKAAFEVAVAQGYLGHVGNTVQALTGRATTRVRDVLVAAHAARAAGTAAA